MLGLSGTLYCVKEEDFVPDPCKELDSDSYTVGRGESTLDARRG